jgi:hypothetical protein
MFYRVILWLVVVVVVVVLLLLLPLLLLLVVVVVLLVVVVVVLYCSLPNNPKERSSQLLRARSLKSPNVYGHTRTFVIFSI